MSVSVLLADDLTVTGEAADGNEATGFITAASPAVRVLVLTTFDLDVGRILAKLGLRDRVQIVVLAYEAGLVQPGAR